LRGERLGFRADRGFRGVAGCGITCSYKVVLCVNSLLRAVRMWDHGASDYSNDTFFPRSISRTLSGLLRRANAGFRGEQVVETESGPVVLIIYVPIHEIFSSRG
jgi:hypothetical protein